MRIGLCVLHACARSIKLGWLLMERGHSVHLITERPIPSQGHFDFDSVNVLYTGHLDRRELFIEQLYSTFKTLAPVLDVVYFANEPDWPVEVIRKAVGPNKPIIFDCHDMVSMRNNGVADEYETKAWEMADGFLAPSALYKELMQQAYPFKPAFEVLSCVPEKLYPKERRTPRRSGLVWEGGVKGAPKEGSEQFEFRNWAEVFREVSKLGVETWIYPSSHDEDFSNYLHSGAIFMQSLPYDQLLKNLTAHEVGLVGSPHPHPAFIGALPNKLFEYMAAGLPIIAYNAPTVSDFIGATQMGKTVHNLSDIPDAINEIKKEGYAEYIWNEGRYAWTLERQITKVETLINQVVTTKNFEQYGHGNVDLSDTMFEQKHV